MPRLVAHAGSLRPTRRLVASGGALRPVAGSGALGVVAPAPPPPPTDPADLTAATTAAFLDPFSTVAALTTVGATVEVTGGPDAGRFTVVSDNALASDGLTVFVHPGNLSAEQATGSLPTGTVSLGVGQLELRSVRAEYGVHPTEGVETVPWLWMHGHGAGNTVTTTSEWHKRPFVDVALGRVLVPGRAASRISSASGAKGLRYRYATGPLRLVRERPPLTVDGTSTTRYVEPRWAGVDVYPADYVPKPTAPPTPNDHSDPDTIWTYGPYDATGAIGWAAWRAQADWVAAGGSVATASATAPEPVAPVPVIYEGVYGYTHQPEAIDGVVHRPRVVPNYFLGLEDGAGSSHDVTAPAVYDNVAPAETLRRAPWLCGVRLLKGAPERYMAGQMDARDPAYNRVRDVRTLYTHNGDGWVGGFAHGRDAARGRLLGLYVGGNLEENEYVFSAAYSAGYRAPAPSTSNGTSHATDLFRNPTNWTGFNTGSLLYAGARRSADVLDSCWFDDQANSGVISNDWNDFAGSRRLRVTSSPCNHFLYGLGCGEGGAIEDTLVEGDFLGHALVSNQTSVMRRHLHRCTRGSNRVGYAMEAVMTKRFNQGAYDAMLSWGGPRTQPTSDIHWHGDTLTFEGLVVDARAFDLPNWLGHDGGGLRVEGLTVLAPDTAPQRTLVDTGDFQAGPALNHTFALTDFDVPHVRTLTSKWAAVNVLRRGVVRAPATPLGSNGAFVVRAGRRPGSAGLLVVDDVDMGSLVDNGQLLAVEADAGGAGLGVDVFVRDSALGDAPGGDPMATLSAPTRIFNRDSRLRTPWNGGTAYYENVTTDSPAQTLNAPAWPQGVVFPEAP